MIGLLNDNIQSLSRETDEKEFNEQKTKAIDLLKDIEFIMFENPKLRPKSTFKELLMVFENPDLNQTNI